MEKLKFNIKGMHCKACATLIEERLTGPGIISAKVSSESNKAVVMYNPQKIKKAEIFQKVKSAGEYTPEEIADERLKEEKNENEEDGEITPPQGHQISLRQEMPAAKSQFIIGLLTGLSIISLGFNIFLGTAYLKSSPSNNNQLVKNNNGQAVGANLAVPPTGQPPAPAAKQSFQITKNDHVRGNFNAPITLVEFSDFECPFCGRHYPTLNKILSDYQDKVRLVYKHFPLSNIHPNAQKAAEASECADEQGKFWEYHDKIFENQAAGYSVEKFKTWATDLNLDSNKFNSCLDSGKYATKVNIDAQEGQSKGVQGTPATFVNGQLVSGALPYDNFKQIIDSLL